MLRVCPPLLWVGGFLFSFFNTTEVQRRKQRGIKESGKRRICQWEIKNDIFFGKKEVFLKVVVS